jgi:hypothetical protein
MIKKDVYANQIDVYYFDKTYIIPQKKKISKDFPQISIFISIFSILKANNDNQQNYEGKTFIDAR